MDYLEHLAQGFVWKQQQQLPAVAKHEYSGAYGAPRPRFTYYYFSFLFFSTIVTGTFPINHFRYNRINISQ
jgi:hypothetical protein